MPLIKFKSFSAEKKKIFFVFLSGFLSGLYFATFFLLFII